MRAGGVKGVFAFRGLRIGVEGAGGGDWRGLVSGPFLKRSRRRVPAHVRHVNENVLAISSHIMY